MNYRPEYEHTWHRRTFYQQLRLDPLPPESAEELLETLIGPGGRGGVSPPEAQGGETPPLPTADPLGQLKGLLIERTEGNPFFLEESVRTLVESGALLGERGSYRLAKPLESIRVPATVQAVLATRLDRLEPEDKRLLQSAAVVGKDVPYALLEAVMVGAKHSREGAVESDEGLFANASPLQAGLDRLQAAEFLYETGLYPDLEYSFKHALTHEVTYGGLLQERRRELHARIVDAIETLHRDRLGEQIERLAHHALQGELWDKVLAYGRQAGEKALARSAYHEALGFFELALSALSHLPEQRATREQAIDLRLALRSALRPLGDFGRIATALREAETLAAALDDPRRLGQVLRFLANHFYVMGAYDQAIAAGQRALALATVSGDVVLHALATYYLGQAYQTQGDYRRAIDSFRETMASREGARRHERFGQVYLPAVLSRALLAECYADLGVFAEGSILGAEGLRIAETVDHRPSLMIASFGVGLLALRQGDLRRALPLLERSWDTCRDSDIPARIPHIAAALGAAYTAVGRVGDAVPLLTKAMEQSTAREVVEYQARCRLSLGEAHLLAGHPEEAQALAEHTLLLARRHQERSHQAYALRLLGEIAARREPPESDQAGDYYRQALALADDLGMRPLVAHCHLGLGKTFRRTGKWQEARERLTTATTMYREMDMRFWLEQAEAELSELK